MHGRRSGGAWKRSGSGWVLRGQSNARQTKLQACYKVRLATLSEGLLSYIRRHWPEFLTGNQLIIGI
jgi:hypothetical protein